MNVGGRAPGTPASGRRRSAMAKRLDRARRRRRALRHRGRLGQRASTRRRRDLPRRPRRARNRRPTSALAPAATTSRELVYDPWRFGQAAQELEREGSSCRLPPARRAHDPSERRAACRDRRAPADTAGRFANSPGGRARPVQTRAAGAARTALKPCSSAAGSRPAPKCPTCRRASPYRRTGWRHLSASSSIATGRIIRRTWWRAARDATPGLGG
jgi:hypothetical protein